MPTTFQTQPYKGTRDFYPDQNQFNNIKTPRQTLSATPQEGTFEKLPLSRGQSYHSGGIDFLLYRQYIFDTWRKTLLESGFVEYDTSIIEQAEIYLAKSGEELGGKQLYNFRDKSDRHIAIRPEMTPTLARIVADKYQQLRFPLRWFSIPNCFRYEAPQKGRLREFWQLNADIIGAEAGAVDLEILVTTAKLFLSFGADKKMFKIIFNHRKVIDLWLTKYNLIDRKTLIYAVLDDWYKFSTEINSEKLKTELNENEIQNLINLCAKEKQEWQDYLEIAKNFEEIKLALDILPQILPQVEFEFSPTIIRGLAYYTGLVFEGFNKNPESPRAMFGAGRYDNLLELFNKPQTPAVGVGVGDVTWMDFLKEWDLLDGNKSFENWKKANIKEKVGIMVMREENKNKVLSQNEIEKLEGILGKFG